MKENYTELHKIVLDIYKEFKSICEKNNLRYFAISGTTLGAVLWNGIIPWDDDMDIAMPADDYLKFINICKTHLPKHLSLSQYIWFGAKLHDNRTTFTSINYIHDPKKYNGVFIDIVPLIALPNDDNSRTALIEDLKNFQKFGLLYDRYNDKEFGLTKLQQWKKTILTSYKFGSTKYVMDFSDPRYVLSASGFNRPTIMRFEDTSIPVSSNYEEDLSIQYGKYTKYPDKKTRQSIHDQQSVLKLHTSFKELATQFNQLPEWAKTMFIKKNENEGFYLKSKYYIEDLLSQANNSIKEKDRTINQLNDRLSYYKKHPIIDRLFRIKKTK